MLQIVADRRVPHLERLFADLGRVEPFDGRPTREQLARSDVLLVRSTTRVDAALLEGSPVRFVGSTTAGTDHLDLPGLQAAGVEVVHAPGSNAAAVAEYVACALVHLGARQGQTLGILGRGQVGRRVVRHAEALGLRVLVRDPPLGLLAPLEELLAADWLTCHVPLDRSTEGLVPHAAGGLINTSRGPVLGPAAYGARPLVLDVYPVEPADPVLVARADLATPHVAGHSLDGKAAMARMVYEELCRFVGRRPAPVELVPPPRDPLIHTPPGERDLAAALRQVYDLAAESARFQASGADWRLRHDRPPRWELRHFRFERPADWPSAVVQAVERMKEEC